MCSAFLFPIVDCLLSSYPTCWHYLSEFMNMGSQLESSRTESGGKFYRHRGFTLRRKHLSGASRPRPAQLRRCAGLLPCNSRPLLASRPTANPFPEGTVKNPANSAAKSAAKSFAKNAAKSAPKSAAKSAAKNLAKILPEKLPKKLATTLANKFRKRTT